MPVMGFPTGVTWDSPATLYEGTYSGSNLPAFYAGESTMVNLWDQEFEVTASAATYTEATTIRQNFALIPEPTTLAILAIGGLVALKRKR